MELAVSELLQDVARLREEAEARWSRVDGAQERGLLRAT